MKDQEPVAETLGFLQFGNAEKRGLVLNQGFRKEHITCQASNTCRWDDGSPGHLRGSSITVLSSKTNNSSKQMINTNISAKQTTYISISTYK